MAKFHVNDKGEARQCGAEKGNCPFGGESVHYPTVENAQLAYELSNAGQAMPQPVKKAQTPTSPNVMSSNVMAAHGFLRPTPQVESRVNSWPSCYTPEADDALRNGTAELYEYAETKPTRSQFDAKAQEIFGALSRQYEQDGMSDTGPRAYWYDHKDHMMTEMGWDPRW